MDTYKIHPLRVGTAIRDDILDPITSYYLEGDHKIVVDTGGVDPDGEHWMPYWKNPGETVPEALAKIGVNAEDIEIVLLTHLHWDHAGGNRYLPNARFLVQRKEYEFLSEPPQCNDPGLAAKQILATDYELLDGDTQIVPGVEVILTAGHTPGMQSVVVTTTEGKYALAGDAVIKKAQWDATPKILNDWGCDSELFHSVMKKFEEENITLLPFHDLSIHAKPVYP